MNFLYKISDIGRGRGVGVPRAGRDIPGVLRLGPADDAGDLGAERDISGSHVPHERPDNGHQGHPVVPLGAVDRRTLGRLGPQVLPLDHGGLHLRSHTPHEHKHLVVLRDDIDKRSFRLHILRRLRLRRRHHRGEPEVQGLRTG